MQDNVITMFPTRGSVDQSSEVDPPFDYRTYAIQLEHEVAEHSQVISEQAIKLKRYRRGSVSVTKFSAAVLVAFCVGWQLPAPDTNTYPVALTPEGVTTKAPVSIETSSEIELYSI